MSLSLRKSTAHNAFQGVTITVFRRTGYENIRETMRDLFGDEVIDKTGPVYGLDEEGEFRSSYRRSGHPGVRCLLSVSPLHPLILWQLWFAAGDFVYSRFYSKRLVACALCPLIYYTDTVIICAGAGAQGHTTWFDPTVNSSSGLSSCNCVTSCCCVAAWWKPCQSRC